MNDTLADDVHHLKTLLAADVCEVYLSDVSSTECVLQATDGLEPRAVGTVRFGPGEGLVGTVFATGQPLRLDAAEQHPQFRRLPQFGDKLYPSFLGVPIIKDGRTLGVLSVRQTNRRVFTEAEEQVLAETATRLARLISVAIEGGPALPGQAVSGRPGAPGLGMGIGVLPSPAADLDSVPDRSCDDVDVEEASFQSAVEAVRAELRASGARLASVAATEAHALFRVWADLLNDGQLFAGAIERIRAGSWAPGALRATIAGHTAVFEAMEDPYLRAQAEDIRGLGRRVLMRLQASKIESVVYPENTVLVGEEVSIARLADVPIERLAAIVCTRSSPHSHSALLARTLRIPAVMGLCGVGIEQLAGRRLLVNGTSGEVTLDPGPLELDELREAQRMQDRRSAELQALRDQPAITRDGTAITLQANVGLESDLSQALARGTAEIGLYRSEFAFMLRDSFPSEDEQVATYRQVLQVMAPAKVTMRTLDIGSDKGLSYFPVQEANPALGWRGIRLTLDHPGLLLTQVRAMLRASVGLDNLRLLMPMISSVAEVDEAKSVLERAISDLAQDGMTITRPEFGLMLEVPAALYQIDALARRADFFSFGTNDLTQYLLAVDRNNPRVVSRYDSLHPAVLRALNSAARELRSLGKPISVCGDMAGDPCSAILLLGMGITTLSVAPPSLLVVKEALRATTREQAELLLQKALKLEDASAVRRLFA